LRVLARWFAYRDDPRSGPGQKWVWQAAEKVLPDSNIGDFNQALMELGSLVCTPVAPKCAVCPVVKWCQAKQQSLQADIPPPPPAKAITEVREVGGVILTGDGVLLFRRRDDAKRGAGMWEFPHGTIDTAADPLAELSRLTLPGLTLTLGQELATTTYSVTRFRYTLTTFLATAEGEYTGSDYSTTAEVPWAELRDYAVTSPQRKVLTLARKQPPRLF
jgi:A/G-specific adenine glycosylase